MVSAQSNTSGFGEIVFTFGVKGDIPIVGDWDGDGIDTAGVLQIRPQPGCGDLCGDVPTWALRNSNTSGTADVSFPYGGRLGAGDWDADFDDTPAGRSGNKWLINNDLDTDSDFDFHYGSASHLPTIGDWDGDGQDSAGVVVGNAWYVRNDLSSGVADFSFKYGISSDIFLTWR